MDFFSSFWEPAGGPNYTFEKSLRKTPDGISFAYTAEIEFTLDFNNFQVE